MTLSFTRRRSIKGRVTHEEFLAAIEECRTARGALGVLRRAASLLERPPQAFAQLEKLLQEWAHPVPIDRATRFAVQVLEEEAPTKPGIMEAKELLSALLLATGERAAEEERRRASEVVNAVARERTGPN